MRSIGRPRSSPAVAVWDVPTRVFHWLLVGLFALSWWSAETGHMDWHQRSGIAVMLLLAFRLMWGIVGGSTARFASFLRGPRGIAAYLTGRAPLVPGHNPIGGWSVIAMLAALALQVGTGLFAVDVDGIESGPLSHWVSFDQGRAAARIHHLSFKLLLALTALHVVAIAFYLVVRRRDLLTPMLSGRDAALGADTVPLAPARCWVLAVVVGVAVLFAWWIWRGAPL